MTGVNAEKFNRLMENEEFVKEMLSQASKEDVQNLYRQNGVEITSEEVDALGVMINQFSEHMDDELDESALEEVTGGSITLAVGVTGWAVLKAVIAVGAAGLAAYKWYKSAH